jgi:hypothetical protein
MVMEEETTTYDTRLKLEEVRRKVWEMLRDNGEDEEQPSLRQKDKLLALNLIKECDECKEHPLCAG